MHGTIANGLLLARGPALAGTVTYSFYTALPSQYAGTTNGDGHSYSSQFDSFTSAERTRVQGELAEISSKVGVAFGFVADGPEVDGVDPAVTADIAFGALSVDQPGSQPGTSVGGYRISSGANQNDLWLYDAGRLSNAGQDRFDHVILHEVGHALGLRHTFEAGLSGAENSFKFSVMAYNPHALRSSDEVPSLQLYDFAALHSLYGASAHESGSTTWSSLGNRVYSVWDSGGDDTIDTSAYGASLIDLRPGYFSSIGAATGVTHSGGSIGSTGYENVSIAFGAYIENATGGGGADVLIGNLFSNKLNGGGGADVLYAEGAVVRGYDAQDGDYNAIGAGGVLTNNRPDPTAQVDELDGGDGDDFIYGGSDGTNKLKGGDGADKVYSISGTDTVEGGGGADLLHATESGAWLMGDGANDTIDARQVDQQVDPDTGDLTGGVTVVFRQGDGHDTVLYYTVQEDGFLWDERYDEDYTITRVRNGVEVFRFEDVQPGGIELVWNASVVYQTSYAAGRDESWSLWSGTAKLRIEATGETIDIGIVNGWEQNWGNTAQPTGTNIYGTDMPRVMIGDDYAFVNIILNGVDLSGGSFSAAAAFEPTPVLRDDETVLLGSHRLHIADYVLA